MPKQADCGTREARGPSQAKEEYADERRARERVAMTAASREEKRDVAKVGRWWVTSSLSEVWLSRPRSSRDSLRTQDGRGLRFGFAQAASWQTARRNGGEVEEWWWDYDEFRHDCEPGESIAGCRRGTSDKQNSPDVAQELDANSFTTLPTYTNTLSCHVRVLAVSYFQINSMSVLSKPQR
ncbi:hypothetical protein CC80DRAFT_548663 [Byssothecium circinans]|uniref:Uncharacterized protein n=1 Tax=Byssothecium circinans TaxID=147558 RepID=A0A6A5U055_9PLEO|nr:hypothetical protein CC80DRAFT_548663 [Byssothecium circinans]